MGRRALLVGSVGLTAAVATLAVTDALPSVDDVPFVPDRTELDWLAARLRQVDGLGVAEVEGWQDAGRRWRDFAPVGVLVHHTGFRATAGDPHPALRTVVDGRSDLPGPLCHLLVDRAGTCHVVSAGRANHAGEAVASGPVPGGDGNVHYVGIEIDYAPQSPYGQAPTPEQRRAAVLAAAAVVDRLGTDADHVRYHAETSTSGKWDPGNFLDADSFRAEVAQALGA